MKLALVILVAFGFVACGGKKVKVDESSAVTKADITLSAKWVKDKKRKFDVSFEIKNGGKKDVLIAQGDIHCFRGDTQGILRGGDRTIDIRAGEARSVQFTCDEFKGDVPGNFRVVIKRVFDNPNHDGITQGKVLASDLTWSHAPR